MALESEIMNRALGRASADDVDWNAVYAAQLPRIYNFFFYRFRNEALAEDLTSRTFEKAWAARRSYRRDLAAFATWLLTIARNVAIDHLRTERAYAPLSAAEEPAAEDSPEADGAQASDVAHLAGLIAALPKRDQELLALKYGAEATNRDIARLTGLTASNVGTLLHRAVKTLRDQW